MHQASTITNLLTRGADSAVAVLSPVGDAPPLTYSALRRLSAGTVSGLNKAGIGRGHRLAIVLPNGPLMATAFLTVAQCATTAPLNSAYTEVEFRFYLEDLGCKALLVQMGDSSPAVAAAAALGIPVIELRPNDPAGCGAFTLPEMRIGEPIERGDLTPDDVVLVLHTSGTTSRPKIVPLTHGNVTASARHIVATLALTHADRCLNIMPLFHIHGLMAAVLASMAAGASIACAPGFDALRFGGWLAASAPSWYTAVPTMHRAILARAARNREIVAASRLRLIRSSSASLPPQVMAALEETFHCPVIESYGMTEAAHQMTSNPLPPAARKPGTVGRGAGPEVAVIGAGDTFVAAGETGEVVIRGPNVTPGYESNPEANAAGFTDGWFRTGDQGVIDADGYLTITGRLKELINRGGEKISPREVDEVLLDHAAVAQAVTFALPHPKLGEDVAAAIVLKDGAEASERELRDFAAGRLAPFKVPRKIVLVGEIPKGPTGKLQRIGLAQKLGLAA